MVVMREEPIPLNDVYERMLEIPGEAMTFSTNRTGADRTERSDLTFSSDALNALRQNMISWVGSRMTRHFQATGRAVQDMEVTITVRTYGALENPVEPRIETARFQAVLDGIHREKGGGSV